MAEYRSNLVAKRMRHRGIYEGKPYEVAGRIAIPEGTTLAAGDVLLAVPVGENQRIKEVTVLGVGDLGAAAGTVGYWQILDSAGNPVVVERIGPHGEDLYRFESPATDADAFAEEAAINGYRRVQVTANVGKLEGPVYVGMEITTAGTAAEDSEIFIGAMFDGETSTRSVTDPYGDNEYLLGNAA